MPHTDTERTRKAAAATALAVAEFTRNFLSGSDSGHVLHNTLQTQENTPEVAPQSTKYKGKSPFHVQQTGTPTTPPDTNGAHGTPTFESTTEGTPEEYLNALGRHVSAALTAHGTESASHPLSPPTATNEGSSHTLGPDDTSRNGNGRAPESPGVSAPSSPLSLDGNARSAAATAAIAAAIAISNADAASAADIQERMGHTNHEERNMGSENKNLTLAEFLGMNTPVGDMGTQFNEMIQAALSEATKASKWKVTTSGTMVSHAGSPSTQFHNSTLKMDHSIPEPQPMLIEDAETYLQNLVAQHMKTSDGESASGSDNKMQDVKSEATKTNERSKGKAPADKKMRANSVTGKTSRRKHVCRVCSKSFSQIGNLKVHERCHSGKKPFQCCFPSCDKTFSQMGNKKAHEALHLGIKPYVCEEAACGKTFNQFGNLKSHQMRAHNKIALQPKTRSALSKQSQMENVDPKYGKYRVQQFNEIDPEKVILAARTQLKREGINPRTPEEIVEKMASSIEQLLSSGFSSVDANGTPIFKTESLISTALTGTSSGVSSPMVTVPSSPAQTIINSNNTPTESQSQSQSQSPSEHQEPRNEIPDDERDALMQLITRLAHSSEHGSEHSPISSDTEME